MSASFLSSFEGIDEWDYVDKNENSFVCPFLFFKNLLGDKRYPFYLLLDEPKNVYPSLFFFTGKTRMPLLFFQ